jgi:NAD(P)-dependent dehydrogenase (short-subunit alcohol dehydrogenase family)
MSLAGRTVLITGGAGSGMGRALVRRFHAEGAQLVVADVDDERIAALASELPDIRTVRADIGTAAGADHAIEAAGGELDVLCNHAGVSEAVGPIGEVSDDDWAHVISVNLTGPFLLCKRAVPMMVSRGGGAIVNTASVAGLRGARGGPAYTASKFGLVGLTQNIAATYAKDGIRCNAICPGPMGSIASETVPGLSERGVAMLSRDREKPSPAAPDLVARVAVFLASDEAAGVNGAIMAVDGGWIAY